MRSSPATPLLRYALPNQARAVASHAEPVVIEMHGDSTGYYFVPDTVHIHTGDQITWKMISGGPHNIAFRDTVGEAADAINRDMRNRMADLSSPMLMNPGETYSVVFEDVPPGTYAYHCTPHLAMGQKGVIIIDP